MIVRLFSLTLLALWGSLNAAPAVLLFDLGHVLVEQSKSRISRHLGLGNLIGYTLFDRKDPRQLRERLYELLHAVRAHESRNTLVTDEYGTALPNIFCDYLASCKDAATLLLEITETIDRLKKENFFCSDREEELLRRLVASIFDPLLFTSFTQPIRKGVKLLKKYAAKKDADGQPLYRIMILSNWNREAFELLCTNKSAGEIFSCVHPDDLIISGHGGSWTALKPYPSAFARAVERAGIEPQEIIFIDNEKVNIAAAQSCGIIGLHLDIHDKRCYEKVDERLTELEEQRSAQRTFMKELVKDAQYRRQYYTTPGLPALNRLAQVVHRAAHNSDSPLVPQYVAAQGSEPHHGDAYPAH